MREIVFGEYRKVMAAVSRHYGMEEEPLLHSNREECVDARATLVGILIDRDLTEAVGDRDPRFGQKVVKGCGYRM